MPEDSSRPAHWAFYVMFAGLAGMLLVVGLQALIAFMGAAA